MIYTFIKNIEKIFSIEKMCQVLQVGRRSYCDWKSQCVSDKNKEVLSLKKKSLPFISSQNSVMAAPE